MARFELRVPDADLLEWKACAAEDGKLLSEWVRESCNAEVSAYKEANEYYGSKGDKIQDVAKSHAFSEANRRESAARKATAGIPGDCECGHARRFHFQGKSCSQCLDCKEYR